MAGPYVCSSTRMRIRSPLQILPFLWASARATIAARRTPGVKRVRVLGFPLFPVYLTLTVWESEEAMVRFVGTSAHRHAMAGFETWARTGRFVRFTSDTRWVSWRRAFTELRDPDGIYERGVGYTRRPVRQAQPEPASVSVT